MMWLAIAVAGALGAVARYLLDAAVLARTGRRWPWGTFVVNVTGSLLAGAMTGLVTSAVVPAELHTVVAGGFLGAYTTFSTAMYESVHLLVDRHFVRGILYVLTPLVASVGAAWLGWALAH